MSLRRYLTLPIQATPPCIRILIGGVVTSTGSGKWWGEHRCVLSSVARYSMAMSSQDDTITQSKTKLSRRSLISAITIRWEITVSERTGGFTARDFLPLSRWVVVEQVASQGSQGPKKYVVSNPKLGSVMRPASDNSTAFLPYSASNFHTCPSSTRCWNNLMTASSSKLPFS